MRQLLIGLLLVSSAQATITLVAHAKANCTTDPCTATSAAMNNTGANLLVVVASTYGTDASTVGVADSLSNTWTAIQNYGGTGSAISYICIWYAKNATVSGSQTFSATGQRMNIYVLAFAGADTSTPLDQQTGIHRGNSIQPSTTGSITPTQNNEVVVSGLSVGWGGGFTPTASGCTVDDFQTSSLIEGGSAHVIQTTAAAIDVSWGSAWTTATYSSVAIASFKAAPVAVPRVIHRVTVTQ